MITYNKLVRDKIPDIIRGSGKECKVEVLDGERYVAELNRKLKEEVQEYLAECDARELADIAEVVYALAKCQGVTEEQLEEIRRKKKRERGGFEGKVFLAWVEE